MLYSRAREYEDINKKNDEMKGMVGVLSSMTVINQQSVPATTGRK